MVDVLFLARLAARLTGERVTFYPERSPDCLGEARMSERGTWEIVLDRDVIEGRVKGCPFLWAFLHECAHIDMRHPAPRFVSDSDRAAARVKYAADMPAILAAAAEREREADRWAAAMAPRVEDWLMRTYGRTFDDLARNGL